MAKTKTTVSILGKEYDIVSEESSQYVHQVAYHVEERMRQLNKDYVTLSTSMLLTLVALNLTDDYFKAKETYAGLQSEVRALREKTREMEIELSITSELAKKMQQSQEEEAGKCKALEEQVRALKAENERLKGNKVTSFHAKKA